MISNKINVNGALHPYDTLTKKDKPSEWDKLDEALSDDQITNIAVSAPYDTGKSSFLSSYFLQHQVHKYRHPIKRLFRRKITDKNIRKDQKKARKKIRQGKTDFRFISVPNFFEDTTGNRNIEVELEKDIIEQLILSTSPSNLPDSSIPRLVRIRLIFIAAIYVLLVLLVKLIANIQIKLDSRFEIFVIISIIGAPIFYYLVHFIGKLTIDLSAKFDIGKAKIKADFISKEDQDNKDSFVQYNDELNYFFDVTKVRYVIFEDLDRYNTPLIFQRLRSLNKRLNSHRNKPIVFIYTIKDTIFDVTQNNTVADTTSNDDENYAAEQKSKFFDYVISLVPFEDVSNSVYLFKHELDKYNWLDVDDKYLYGLGLFITDYREIIAIVSDMAVYFINVKSKLPNYSGNKLLGAMVYKNVYLSDFNNIYEHKSKLEYLLKENYVLDKYMDFAIRGVVDENENEIFTGSTIDYSLPGKINFWSENKTGLDKMGYYNPKLSEAMEFCQNKPILKYLLNNELLENDFFNYVFPIKYGNINVEDNTSMQRILSKTIDNNIHFNNPEAALAYLDKINFDFKYAYSSDILKLLLEKASMFHYRNPEIHNEREEQAYALLETVNNNIDYDFMTEIMQKLLEGTDIEVRDMFIQLAFDKQEVGSDEEHGSWTDYFTLLFIGNSGKEIDERVATKFIINYWNEREKYTEHHLNIDTSIDGHFFKYFQEYLEKTKDKRINKPKVWMIGTFKDLNPALYDYADQQ